MKGALTKFKLSLACGPLNDSLQSLNSSPQVGTLTPPPLPPAHTHPTLVYCSPPLNQLFSVGRYLAQNEAEVARKIGALLNAADSSKSKYN